MNKIKCPNCKLPALENEEVCRYCGSPLHQDSEQRFEEEVIEAHKKTFVQMFPSYSLFFLVAAGLTLLSFLVLILPASFNYLVPGYVVAFNPPAAVGVNAATICFVFMIVTLLNFAAVLWSVKKKSTEISLFAYFAAFTGLIVLVVAAIAPIMLSGTGSEYGFGLCFLVLAIFYAAITALIVIGVIKYKQYLIKNPSEIAAAKM